MSSFIVGVDLGKAQTYTAIAVVERIPAPQRVEPGPPGSGKMVRKPVVERPTYHLRHLERPNLGTTYPAIVERVVELMRSKELGSRASLIVDATGVGAPVVDLLKQAKLSPVPVLVTGGDKVTFDEGDWRVPKRDLATTVDVLLQTERLQFAEDLPLGSILAQELLSFRVKISLRTAHDSYEAWREGQHDDLVFAVCLACWWGERMRTRPRRRTHAVVRAR